MGAKDRIMDLDVAFQLAFAGRLGGVLEDLMPGGRLVGREYLCASLQGGAGDSCRTDVITGVGSDTASGRSWNHVSDLLGILQHDLTEWERATWFIDNCEALYQRIHTIERQPKPQYLVISPIPEDAPPRLEQHPRYGTPLKFWEYRSGLGRVLHYTALFEVDSELVSLPQCLFYNEQEGFVWRWEPMPEPRPLFSLEAIYHSNPDRLVLLVKDERAADAARQIFPDLPCTCWSGGWSDAAKADFQPLLGEYVHIWPDNTLQGAEMALSLARRLDGEVEIVSILCLPDVFPNGWSLGDPLPENFEPWDLLVDAMSASDFAEHTRLKFASGR